MKITAQCGECQIISGKKEPPTAYQIHVHGTNKRVQVFALYVVLGTSTPRQCKRGAAERCGTHHRRTPITLLDADGAADDEEAQESD